MAGLLAPEELDGRAAEVNDILGFFAFAGDSGSAFRGSVLFRFRGADASEVPVLVVVDDAGVRAERVGAGFGEATLTLRVGVPEFLRIYSGQATASEIARMCLYGQIAVDGPLRQLNAFAAGFDWSSERWEDFYEFRAQLAADAASSGPAGAEEMAWRLSVSSLDDSDGSDGEEDAEDPELPPDGAFQQIDAFKVDVEPVQRLARSVRRVLLSPAADVARLGLSRLSYRLHPERLPPDMSPSIGVRVLDEITADELQLPPPAVGVMSAFRVPLVDSPSMRLGPAVVGPAVVDSPPVHLGGAPSMRLGPAVDPPSGPAVDFDWPEDPTPPEAKPEVKPEAKQQQAKTQDDWLIANMSPGGFACATASAEEVPALTLPPAAQERLEQAQERLEQAQERLEQAQERFDQLRQQPAKPSTYVPPRALAYRVLKSRVDRAVTDKIDQLQRQRRTAALEVPGRPADAERLLDQAL